MYTTYVDSTLASFSEDIPLGKISHYRGSHETVILSFLPFYSLRKALAAKKRSVTASENKRCG